MDIAKLQGLKLTDPISISNPIHHQYHRQNRSYSSVGISGCQNEDNLLLSRSNFNCYTPSQNQEVFNHHQYQQDSWKEDDDNQQEYGKSNQFTNSNSVLNSNSQQNYKNQQDRHNENETALILTPIIRESKKSIPANQLSHQSDATTGLTATNKEKYFLQQQGEDDNYHYYHQHSNHGGQNNGDKYPNDGNYNTKLNSHDNTSWNRIFQCFSVFKPRKISSTNPTSTSFDVSTDTNIKDLKPQQPELRKIMTDLDLYLQELADTSEILNKTDAKNLGKHFPPRAVGSSWDKIFSTTTDGFSLHNLYRKMDGVDSPVIFVIEDIEERVFGAVLSCGFKVSENFYGNCETFLFRCRPEFEVFKWSGDNFYFIQGQDGFISVGCDDGRHGLWLDDNLFLGRSEKCSTFNSPPLIAEQDFKIKTIECWTVGLV